MPSFTKIIAITSTLLLSTAAAAETYVGVSSVFSEYDYEDIQVASGVQVFGGYRSAASPLMMEIGYVDSGEADIDDFADSNGQVRGASLSLKGFSVLAGYAKPVDPNGSTLWFKAGFYRGDSQFRGRFTSSGGSFSLKGEEKSSGLSLGVGGEWMFSRRAGLRLDLQVLDDVKDLPGLDSSHKSQVNQFHVGLVWRFSPPPPALAVAPPPTAAAAPVAEPVMPVAEVPAPPVPAPMAAAPAPGVFTAAAVTLRAQPKAQAHGLAALGAGATISIQGTLTNAEGQWFYVDAGGRRGWLQAAEVVQR